MTMNNIYKVYQHTTPNNKVYILLNKPIGYVTTASDQFHRDTVLDLIKTNWSLGIFPEGKICHSHSIENIQKGFTLIAKKAKMDIVPIGIAGFDGYAGKSLFKKHITVKVGKPISYELPSEEILKQWAEQICEYTGYENKLANQLKEKVDA